jgi:hypothetical protein
LDWKNQSLFSNDIINGVEHLKELKIKFLELIEYIWVQEMYTIYNQYKLTFLYIDNENFELNYNTIIFIISEKKIKHVRIKLKIYMGF